jgi:DNA-binding CsgD family transcriptional regulator/tetratricopeptide (TPR) repeat protein
MTVLDDALVRARAGRPALVLATGEAGIGKSRLVSEFSQRAIDAGALTAIGSAIELAAGALPYSPFIRVFSALRPNLDVQTAAWLADSSRAPLRRLVPAFADMRTGSEPQPLKPSGPDATEVPALYEACLGLLELLAASRPLVIALEDLHWADRSTLDLLRFIVRSTANCQLLIIATARSDEPAAELGSFLEELGRQPEADWVELRRLDAASVRAMVEGIRGVAVSDADADLIFARSGGNPFFVEEIVASGHDGQLSPTVRQVALARVAKLSADAYAVLAAVAIAGRQIGHGQLASVLNLPPKALSSAIREAVESFILAVGADGEGYQFRHALIAEAVSDDILPGERQRLHRAHAKYLERAGLLDASMAAATAHHWDRGHMPRAAVSAYMAAAAAAEAIGAYPEALEHLGRALALLPAAVASAGRQPDVEAVDEVAVREQAARVAHLRGDPIRAVELLEPTLSSPQFAFNPERKAVVLEQLARYRWVSPDVEGALADAARAADLVSFRPASSAKARVLTTHAWTFALSGRYDEADRIATAALEVATAVGDRAEQGHALGVLGIRALEMQPKEAALAALRSALAIAVETNDIEAAVRAYANLLSANFGQWDRVVALGEEAIGYVETRRIRISLVVAVLANLAQSYLELGHWDDAEVALGKGRALAAAGMYGAEVSFAAARLAIARGALHDAQRLIELAEAASISVPGRQAALLTEIQLCQRRWLGVREVAVPAIAEIASGPVFSFVLSWICLPEIRAEAELAAAARARGDTAALSESIALAETGLAAIEAQATNGELHVRIKEALALGRAEMSRVRGRSDPSLWRVALATAGETGSHYHEAYPQIRLAEALMESGLEPAPGESAGTRHRRRRSNRLEAIELLGVAHRTAAGLGAAPLLVEVVTIARRAGVALGGDTGPAVSSGAPVGSGDDAGRSGLTRREVDVLRLVVQGRTNRQIGQMLFITERTAAIHVQHVLAKLDVANRVEAAALAHRIGFDGNPTLF